MMKLITLWLFVSFLQFASRSVYASPELLRSMTYNIRYGLAEDGEHHWRNRRDKVVQIIRQADPDVIGVQEAMLFQLQELLVSLPDYGMLGEAREGSGNGEYSAILYRKSRISVLQSDTFWLSDTPETPSASWGNHFLRICTLAKLKHLATDQNFTVFNTHLDHQSQPSREKGMALILENMTASKVNEPLILMGDFNVTEENKVITMIKEHGNTQSANNELMRFTDSLVQYKSGKNSVSTFNGFKTSSAPKRIDYIFVNKGFEITAANIITDKIDGLFPSDHFPVTANLKFR